jgi:hypothetical protein
MIWRRFSLLVLGAAALGLVVTSGTAAAEKIALTSQTEKGQVGTFTVDTDAHLVTYELNPDVVGKKSVVRIHGWAPKGWDSRPLLEINPGRSLTGVWRYRPQEEPNVLSGLSYVTVTPVGRKQVSLRAQLVQEESAVAQFPMEPASMTMAGTCHLPYLAIANVVNGSEAQMEPAQVQMFRSAPGDRDHDGLRDMDLAVQVRVGGGYVPGLGHIDIELINEQNPGRVEALSPNSDFPARMTMTIKKRYITPVGTFVGDPETYSAIINSIPPYGAELQPQDSLLHLYDEQTGAVVGTFQPGVVVPLFYVAPPEFPGPLASTPKPASVAKARLEKARTEKMHSTRAVSRK